MKGIISSFTFLALMTGMLVIATPNTAYAKVDPCKEAEKALAAGLLDTQAQVDAICNKDKKYKRPHIKKVEVKAKNWWVPIILSGLVTGLTLLIIIITISLFLFLSNRKLRKSLLQTRSELTQLKGEFITFVHLLASRMVIGKDSKSSPEKVKSMLQIGKDNKVDKDKVAQLLDDSSRLTDLLVYMMEFTLMDHDYLRTRLLAESEPYQEGSWHCPGCQKLARHPEKCEHCDTPKPRATVRR